MIFRRRLCFWSFYIIDIYGYSLYIPYIFHIYFLAMFHISKWAYAQTAALEGCLTLAPGSEAAVWDNWSAKIWSKKSTSKSMTNDAKSMNIYVGGCLLSHVGSRWHLLEAILAQDDREDQFFIDFLESFWDTKIIQKSMKKWSDFQTP